MSHLELLFPGWFRKPLILRDLGLLAVALGIGCFYSCERIILRDPRPGSINLADVLEISAL